MHDKKQFIARSVLDTNLLPLRDRVPLWRDSATSVWDVSRLTDETFYASVDAFHAGDLMFGTVKSSGQVTERVNARIAVDSLDYYMLQFYVSGKRSARSRGREQIAQQGDLLVVDMTQPLKTASTEYQSFDLVLPRRLFDPLLREPDAFGGLRIDADLPLVGLLRSHIRALFAAGPKMTYAEAIAMQEPTLALAAAALNGTITEEYAPRVRKAAWLAVRRYIEDGLVDFNMTADSVARHFGFSRATLYRIMEPVQGFANYLRQRRLMRSRQDLANPKLSHLSIGEIAYRWGFDPTPFSRLFSREFGQSPRDYRAVSLGKAGKRYESASEIEWSRWLAAM
ncbi:helix-turn-helix domain-containing protein [Brucella sp. BE17]|uniref:helix-turn-helix domain-containing protein n=1 Tax=Brucella sp. BE17 TaxID=3142977 RepID=UPI0031BB8BC6